MLKESPKPRLPCLPRLVAAAAVLAVFLIGVFA